MNINNEKNETLTTEDYSQAMNFIGQNLFSSLVQCMEKLHPQLRNQKMVANALSAFLVNVIYKQFPDNHESCQHMLDEINKLVKMQLDNIPKTTG